MRDLICAFVVCMQQSRGFFYRRCIYYSKRIAFVKVLNMATTLHCTTDMSIRAYVLQTSGSKSTSFIRAYRTRLDLISLACEAE